MIKMFLMISFLAISVSEARVGLGGPVISGGVPPTANLVSKKKIQAVLEAITGENDVVLGVELAEGGLTYNVKIRNNTECSIEAYQVKPISKGPGPLKFSATFQDSLYAGPCD